MKNADLRDANLWGVRLENADLRDADLTDSNLNNAYFGTMTPGQPGFERGTDLRHATLTRAQLKNTNDFGVALAEGVIGLADDERSRLADKHDRLGAWPPVRAGASRGSAGGRGSQ